MLLHGEIVVNGSATLKGTAQIATLSTSGETIALNAREPSLVLILSGEPIHEPVASYGPFVMNTQAELRQAVEDYQAGKMGRV